jgi:hypothetical protein
MKGYAIQAIHREFDDEGKIWFSLQRIREAEDIQRDRLFS